MGVKERLIEFITHLGIAKTAFERNVGLSNGYISKFKGSIGVDKLVNILRIYPQLNKDWLLTGEGEMLQSSIPQIVQNNQNGDNNYVGGNQYKQCPECGSSSIENIEATEIRKPIIPTEWTYQTDIDIYEKVQKEKYEVSKSKFIALGIPIDMWHIVRDDSLLPDCKRGDMIGLSAYPIGSENPIPGKLHAIDTCSNGILIRKLYIEDWGYRGVAPNPEYPEMEIKKEDIIRVYRIVCLARIAI